MTQTGYLYLLGGKQLTKREKALERMRDSGVELRYHNVEELKHLIPDLMLDFSDDEEVEMMGKRNMNAFQYQLLGLFVFISFLFLSTVPLILIAQDSSEATVIKNVRIFDGEGIIPKGSVVIQNGKIIAVGQKIKVPEGTKIFDGKGQTLLPGLIDAHVHVWDPQNLKQSLVFGVTTVVDMFMNV